MQVIIDNGNKETLTMIHPMTGQNLALHLISSSGACNDGQFVWSDEDQAYHCSFEIYSKWFMCLLCRQSVETRLDIMLNDMTVMQREVLLIPFNGLNVLEWGPAVKAMLDKRMG